MKRAELPLDLHRPSDGRREQGGHVGRAARVLIVCPAHPTQGWPQPRVSPRPDPHTHPRGAHAPAAPIAGPPGGAASRAGAAWGGWRECRGPGPYRGWILHLRTPPRAPALHPWRRHPLPPRPGGHPGAQDTGTATPGPGGGRAGLRAGESLDVGKSLSPRRGRGAGWARFSCCPGARAAPRRARLSPARAPSRPAASPSGDRLSSRGRRALLPRGAAGLHPSPRLGTPASGRIPARSGSGVRSEEPRESGSERGSRGGECARVWRSERARECACLTRGEVCKGRIPSFLPQPLVETRRMQRPPGRSAAQRRAAGGRRAGPRTQPGSPAPAPTAPLPRLRGPEARTPPSPAAGKPPGECSSSSSQPRSARRERPQEGSGLSPCLAVQLPRGTRGRLDPVPTTPLARLRCI